MQQTLMKSKKILKLNVSEREGVTCLNTDDFAEERDGKGSWLHSGLGYAEAEKRIREGGIQKFISETIEEFKEYYNCDRVSFYNVPNPLSYNPLEGVE